MTQEAIVHLIVHGRVQGVGYRAWAQDTANRLGLDGWVRNRRSGEVELLISGHPEVVARMIEACRAGPSFAHVTRIDEADAAPEEARAEGRVAGFISRPTV